jgi:hypothetical protein
VNLPRTVIFDLDGTVALRDKGPNGRDPYDMTRVGEDAPNEDILTLARLLHQGVTVMFVSGRDETARKQTELWLQHHFGSHDFYLYMRETNDMRPDETIKLEILENVRKNWKIIATFDDRNRVVDMWRANGVTCLQVCSREDGGF